MAARLAIALFYRESQRKEDSFGLTLGVLRFGGLDLLLPDRQEGLQYGTPGTPSRFPGATEGASAPHARNVIFVVAVHRTTAYIGLMSEKTRVLSPKIFANKRGYPITAGLW
jgi:hypothetical protein